MTDLFAQIILKSIILKSKGVYYTDPETGEIHPVAYHPEQWGEGLATHHPFDINFDPKKVDPATGEYSTQTFHPSGSHGQHVAKGGIPGFEHEFGAGQVLWPIQAAANGIVQFMQEKGIDQDTAGESLEGLHPAGHSNMKQLAMSAIDEAITRFNAGGGARKPLPPANDPAWRGVRVGPYPKDPETGEVMDSANMPTYDTDGNLITFYMNSGTTFGEPERGPFPESGALPFYNELKDVLNEWIGRGMSMNFVHQPYVEPNLMNPTMSREASGEGSRGRRTLTPKQEADKASVSHYGEIAPELLIGHHPDAFFHSDLSRGGRPSKEALNMMRWYNSALGWGMSDSQLASAAAAPISAVMTPGKKLTDQGKYIPLLDILGQESGLHPGRKLRHGRWKSDKEGTPEELQAAYSEYSQDPTKWELGVGEHSDIHGKHRSQSSPFRGQGYGQGTMEWTQNALGTIAGAHETGIDLNQVWNEHATREGKQVIQEGSQEYANAQAVRALYQQIAEHRIAEDEQGLGALRAIDFEAGHPEAAINEPMLPREWQSVPSDAVIAATHGQVAPVVQPPVDGPPPLFTYQEGAIEVENRLLKAMEVIQLADAKQDPQVLDLLPTKKSLNITNYDDVSIVANRLDITVHDVHSITASRGDWQNIAKLYQLPPTVVGTVKVAFGGV